MHLPTLATLAAAASLAPAAFAQTTIQVPADQPTIQAGIDAAVDGDTVLVAPGTYVERIKLDGKAITVRGAAGAAATVIDAAGTIVPVGFDTSAIVELDEGEGPLSVLADLTITGAGETDRIVWAPGGTPTLERVVIRDNDSFFATGAFNGGGLLIDCVLENNRTGAGGGVFGDPTIVGCVIRGNISDYNAGGGVFATGPCLIVDSQIVGNQTGGDGYGGGGVAGPATLVGCLIADNRITNPGMVSTTGAGVNGAVAIDRCTIVGNVILNTPCPSFVTCAGAGVDDVGSITNSIVWDNFPDGISAVGSVSWSNVQGGAPGVGNISVDPQFADVAGGDYSLTAGSPSIDAGDPAAEFDADGSIADQGAFPFLGPLTADGFELSLSAGGAQALAVDLGAAFAGDVYVFLGSVSGTSPGVALAGGLLVPLNPDAYTTAILIGVAPLSGAVGVLDGTGGATATVALPAASDPSLAGVVAHHATVAIDPSVGATAVTNAVPLTLVP